MSSIEQKRIENRNRRARLLTSIPIYVSELNKIRAEIVSSDALPIEMLKIVAEYIEGPYADDIIRTWCIVHKSREARDQWYKHIENFTKLKTTLEDRQHAVELHSYFYDRLPDHNMAGRLKEDAIAAPDVIFEVSFLDKIFGYLGLEFNTSELKNNIYVYRVICNYIFSISHINSSPTALVAPGFVISFEMLSGMYSLIYAVRRYLENSDLPRLPIWDYETYAFVPYKEITAILPDTQRDRNARKHYVNLDRS